MWKFIIRVLEAVLIALLAMYGKDGVRALLLRAHAYCIDLNNRFDAWYKKKWPESYSGT